MLILNRKFASLRFYYLINTKNEGFKVESKFRPFLFLAIHIKPFRELFFKTFLNHLKKLTETKKIFEKLIDDEKLFNEMQNKKYFSANTFKKYFKHIFDLDIKDINEKKRCLERLVKHKKSFFKEDLKNIPTDPKKDTSDSSDIERFVLFRHIIDLESSNDSNEIKHLKSLEIFIKRVISRNLAKKSLVPLINENGKLCFYYIYDTIFAKKAMVGYALKSLENNPPIIAFRGTQSKIRNRRSISAFLDNLSKKIAIKGFISGKKKLGEIFNDPNFLTDKAHVVGLSLGGGYAQRTLAEFYDKIDHLITFNSIGIDNDTIDNFNKKLNDEKKQIKITIIRKKNDIAHFLGDAHIGNKLNNNKIKIIYLEKSKIENNLSPSILSLLKSLLNYHSGLFLNENADINPIDVNFNNHLDNKLNNNNRWEKWRKKWLFDYIFNIIKKA
ncbi:MAG: hypothetical protein JXA94_04560 [Parachlamydiales bacterium]|nr:hypothetical protein [Parachlamydiales bacterium]